MRIPCGSDKHWRVLRLYFLFADGAFRAEQFERQLGPGLRTREWLIREPDNESCHSHVELVDLREDYEESDANEEDEASERDQPPRWLVQVQTFRRPLESGVSGEVLQSHEPIFQALLESSDREEKVYSARVDLYFSAKQWNWRAALFDRPGKLEALSSELGRVEVTGLALRFRAEEAGLMEARLEVSPDGARYMVTTGFVAGPSSLTDVFTEVVQQAETYTRLFIEETET